MTGETPRERMERRGREPAQCPLCAAPPMHPSHLARHMRIHGIDRRQPNVAQLGLFGMPTRDGGAEPSRARDRPQRSRALCSQHQHGDKGTTIVRFKDHLYWTEHNAELWSGRTTLCRASSATLCVVPAADGTPCACQTGAPDGE